MGVYEGRGQLTKSLRELLGRWYETKMEWDDAQSKTFEDKHLMPLEQDMKQALGAMDHMATVLSQVRRDCT